jgi:hypothetical protein
VPWAEPLAGRAWCGSRRCDLYSGGQSGDWLRECEGAGVRASRWASRVRAVGLVQKSPCRETGGRCASVADSGSSASIGEHRGPSRGTLRSRHPGWRGLRPGSKCKQRRVTFGFDTPKYHFLGRESTSLETRKIILSPRPPVRDFESRLRTGLKQAGGCSAGLDPGRSEPWWARLSLVLEGYVHSIGLRSCTRA